KYCVLGKINEKNTLPIMIFKTTLKIAKKQYEIILEIIRLLIFTSKYFNLFSVSFSMLSLNQIGKLIKAIGSSPILVLIKKYLSIRCLPFPILKYPKDIIINNIMIIGKINEKNTDIGTLNCIFILNKILFIIFPPKLRLNMLNIYFACLF